MESSGTLFMYLFIALIVMGAVGSASHRIDAAFLAGIMVMVVYQSVVFLNILSVLRDFIRLFTDPAQLAKQEVKGALQLLTAQSREINSRLGGMYDRIIGTHTHQGDVQDETGERLPQD